MQIELKDGLLVTSLQITNKGITKVIDNVVIDTGAAHSLLSSDVVEDIDIRYLNGDKIVTMYGIGGEEHAFEKVLDSVQLGDIEINSYYMHFGSIDPYGRINGLLGLDLLIKAGIVIDLKNLQMYVA